MGSRRLLLAILILTLLLPACQSKTGLAEVQQLTVFAAASLTEAFEKIASRFEAEHPGAAVLFNFAGSQQLARQLAQGAPADVFASADLEQIEAAVAVGKVDPGAPRLFAGNKLVVIFPEGNPAGLVTLHDLAHPGLKIILADPAVPIGAYTLQFLGKASQEPGYGSDFQQKVLENVVSYEQNVRAVLNKVALGEADAGIVYTSDIASKATSSLSRLPIPDSLNIQAAYVIAPVKDSYSSELARAFIDLVASPAGQAILAAHGFQPPP